jgi:hypothetical protein
VSPWRKAVTWLRRLPDRVPGLRVALQAALNYGIM